ncbi:MAG: 3-phosphoshikimate 1-carboxyvinyltransferase [Thermodesulfobacteriota bacterium]
MIEIRPAPSINTAVEVPGSKSYTHRILIASALSDGECFIQNRLKSEDTELTLNALQQMGVAAEEIGGGLKIHGTGGRLTGGSEIFLGNSGTSMRLLTSVIALAEGETLLTGTDRMKERPVADLLEGLTQIGVKAQSVNGNGCPPVAVRGGSLQGGRIALKCGLSSQFLSGLLLIGPYTREGLEIEVVEGPVSKPYIDLTLEVMERLGVPAERRGYERFFVAGNRIYRAGPYTVETDASNASYFWGAAAITGGTVTVRHIDLATKQGDIRILECFQRMGCRVAESGGGVAVTGGPLSAIEVDMADMPDMVPTLAVVAAFADGRTVIRNVAHLRAKESDRLAAVAAELTKMAISVTEQEDGLIIQGGSPKGARIDTYDDHRIAMSFAMAGLRVPGVMIEEERCVDKSFPDFWRVFEGMNIP